jgi:hypothetical protein
MADEIKFRLRKSKDGKYYQVIRADGSSRPHFLSVDKLNLPIPVEAIRYGRDPRRVAHRSGAFMYQGYWRQFIAITDVDIARRGDSSEEEVTDSDPRVTDFFALAVPVRVEDAARALAVFKREKAEADSAPPAEQPASQPAQPASSKKAATPATPSSSASGH